jgi:hypothetical protein
MFQLEDQPTFWWPVPVRRPDPVKPGEMVEHRFEAQFRWLDHDEYDDWLKDAREKNLRDSQAVEPLLVAVRGVGAGGQLLDSTADNLARVRKKHGTDLVKAYVKTREEAAQKNS